jgi:hypothetical protein
LQLLQGIQYQFARLLAAKVLLFFKALYHKHGRLCRSVWHGIVIVDCHLCRPAPPNTYEAVGMRTKVSISPHAPFIFFKFLTSTVTTEFTLAKEFKKTKKKRCFSFYKVFLYGNEFLGPKKKKRKKRLINRV